MDDATENATKDKQAQTDKQLKLGCSRDFFEKMSVSRRLILGLRSLIPSILLPDTSRSHGTWKTASADHTALRQVSRRADKRWLKAGTTSPSFKTTFDVHPVPWEAGAATGR